MKKLTTLLALGLGIVIGRSLADDDEGKELRKNFKKIYKKDIKPFLENALIKVKVLISELEELDPGGIKDVIGDEILALKNKIFDLQAKDIGYAALKGTKKIGSSISELSSKIAKSKKIKKVTDASIDGITKLVDKGIIKVKKIANIKAITKKSSIKKKKKLTKKKLKTK